MQIEQVRAEQRDEVIAFLRKVFGAADDAPFLDPRLMDWKYFEERPEWSGSRSYVLRVGKRIAAHGGILTSTLLLPDGPITDVQIIDWAADKAFPGAGLVLVKHLGELGDVNIGPSGSSDCVSVLKSPEAGHELFAQNLRMSRVVWPWLRLWAEKPFGARSLARLGRDFWRSFAGSQQGTPGWSATPVDMFTEPIPPAPPPNSDFTPVVRSAELLNYMLRCPAVKMSGYLLRRNGEARGHFLLSHTGVEIRIAELQIASQSEEDWRACFRVAIEAATALRPKAWSVRTSTLPEMIQRAARSAGLVECSPKDAFLRDPHGRLAGRPAPNLTMIDTDAAYL